MDTTLIFAFIALFSFLGVVFIAAKGGSDSSKKKKQLYNTLNEIELMIRAKELSPRDAIIRLDTLMAKSLQFRYKNDESCGENLKKAKTLFKKNEYNDIWTYHKLRNKVVHDDADLTYSQLNKATEVFKKAISKIVG